MPTCRDPTEEHLKELGQQEISKWLGADSAICANVARGSTGKTCNSMAGKYQSACFSLGWGAVLYCIIFNSLPSSHPIQKPQRRDFKIRKRLQYIIYAPFVGVISNLYTCPIVQSNFIAVAKGSSRSCNGQVVSRRNRSTLGQRVPNDSTTFGRWRCQWQEPFSLHRPMALPTLGCG